MTDQPDQDGKRNAGYGPVFDVASRKCNRGAVLNYFGLYPLQAVAVVDYFGLHPKPTALLPKVELYSDSRFCLRADAAGVLLLTKGFFREHRQFWPRNQIEEVYVGTCGCGGRPVLLIGRRWPCAHVVLDHLKEPVLEHLASVLRRILGMAPEGVQPDIVRRQSRCQLNNSIINTPAGAYEVA